MLMMIQQCIYLARHCHHLNNVYGALPAIHDRIKDFEYI